MSQSQRERWMQDLLERAQTVYSPQPPRHVLERVGALLYTQPIRYVDPDLRGNMGDDLLTGRICVFTDDFLAVLDVEGVPASFPGSDSDASTGRITVEFVPRSSLARVTIEGDGTSFLNSAAAWSRQLEDDPWPGQDARVDLHYPGLAAPVTVPSHFREPFGAFLPSLLGDLRRPGGPDGPAGVK